MMIYHFDDYPNVKIFTTGAFLRPLKVTDCDGKDCWVWTVSSFIENCYDDGDVFNPPVVAGSLEKLLMDDEDGEIEVSQ